MKPIQVMVVDGSERVRGALAAVLSRFTDIRVVAALAGPVEATAFLETGTADVLLLDVTVPGALEFLRVRMQTKPIATVVLSAFSAETSRNAIAALECGAIDLIYKPAAPAAGFFAASAERLREAVCGAAAAHVSSVGGGRAGGPARVVGGAPTRSLRPRRLPQPVDDCSRRVILIGASTGGSEALRIFLSRCDARTPPIVVAQHMPPGFTRSLAARLDELCDVRVREAEHGELLERGHVSIAPGDRHVMVRCADGRHYLDVVETPPVNRHRPSVDVLFHSAARACGDHAVGVILTGMGDDGARGLKAMREAGCATFAQDEATCVVYGMPREAVRLGAASRVLPLRALTAAALSAARG